MAYFAEISETNEVLRCVSVSDNDCLDSNGVESEDQGSAFCRELFGGGRWIKTSFTGRIRKNFATVGMFYYDEHDVFAFPPPKPWYRFNANFEWEVPVGIHPDTGESLQDWQWEYLEVAYALKPDYSALTPNS